MLIIIPAYNEEPSISPVVCSVKTILPGARILVIDDASTDDTNREAKRAGGVRVFLVAGEARTGQPQRVSGDVLAARLDFLTFHAHRGARRDRGG